MTVSTDVSKYMGNAVSLANIWGSIIYNVKSQPYLAKGDGINDDTTAIMSTITAASVNGGVVAFPPGTYIVDNITVPANVTLWIENGAKLSINSGKTVTIYGSIDAGIYQIFAGAGSVAGTLRADKVYPQWWGAKGDAVTDDAAAIQSAMNASLSIFFPRGIYLVGSTLKARGRAVIEGENAESTMLKRKNTNYGHTLVVGTDDNVGLDYANDFAVRNLWFYREFTYTAGTTTTIQYPLSAGTAHLKVNSGQNGIIENNMFDNAPINIDLVSCSLVTVRKNSIKGMIYDDTIAGLQEGYACIRIINSTVSPVYSQLISIYDNYITGGYVSVPRSVTIGTVTTTMVETVGCLYGIYVEASEGLTVHGNYFGANNRNNIYFHSTKLVTNLKITGNFFDGAKNYCIAADSLQIYPIVGLQICDNDFNLQTISPGAIFIMGYDGWITTYKVVIADNNIENSTKTPILLFGAKGVNATGNNITAYNTVGGGNNDPLYSAGIYVDSITTDVYTANNVYGGGVNNLHPTSNGCKSGIYYGTGTGFSINERTVGFGVAGGKVIDGTRQVITTRPNKIQPTLLGAWTSLVTPFYYMDNDGIVHIEGYVTGGAIGSAIFTLPVGFRPAATKRFPIVSNDAFGALYIDSSGSVVCYLGNNASVSLEGISFASL